MMRLLEKVLGWGFAFVCFGACGTRCLANNVYIFPNKVWNIHKTVDFQFEVASEMQAYDCIIQLTNTADYPYANLCMKYTIQGPDSSCKAEVELQLFDRKTGKPLGSGLVGKRHNCCLLANHRFPKAGSYRVSLVHDMRQDSLPGLCKIAFLARPSIVNK